MSHTVFSEYANRGCFLREFAGTLSAPSSNAKLSTTNNRTILEHKARSISGTFTVQWKAPSAGTGSVSIYGTGLAVNGSSTSGDQARTLSSAVVLTEGTISSTQRVQKASIQYTVFPNPTSDYIYINHNIKSGEASLQVHNFSGQMLLQKQVELLDNQQIELNIQRVPTGTYTLSIHQNGSVYSKIIQKQ